MAMVNISQGDARDDERLPCSVEISTVGLLVQGILPIFVFVCILVFLICCCWEKSSSFISLGRFPTTLVVGLGFVQRRVVVHEIVIINGAINMVRSIAISTLYHNFPQLTSKCTGSSK
ncbi:hypothetical protein AHAS_Ahas09G0131300 [Arachis hypogaea]